MPIKLLSWLKQRASLIRNETEDRKNTADRVGEWMEAMVSSGIFKYDPTKPDGYEAGSLVFYNGVLYEALFQTPAGQTPNSPDGKVSWKSYAISNGSQLTSNGTLPVSAGVVYQLLQAVNQTTTGSIPNATELILGKVRRSTLEEAGAGVNNETYITPAQVKAITTTLVNEFNEAVGSINNNPIAALTDAQVQALCSRLNAVGCSSTGGGGNPGGGGGTIPASVTSVSWRKDESGQVEIVLQATNGNNFEVRVYGEDVAYNTGYTTATRISGGTDSGTYLATGYGYLAAGTYWALGRPKGLPGVNDGVVGLKFTITAADITPTNVFKVGGNPRVTSIMPGIYGVEQKYTDGNFYEYFGVVDFYPTQQIPGVTLSLNTDIPNRNRLSVTVDDTITQDTSFQIIAAIGELIYRTIQIGPEPTGGGGTPALISAVFTRFEPNVGRIATASVRTQVEGRRLYLSAGGNVNGSSEWRTPTLLTGTIETGATVQIIWGFASTTPGTYYFWDEWRVVGDTSGSVVRPDKYSETVTASGGNTGVTPWAYDNTPGGVLQIDWIYLKNNPQAGQPTEAYLYFKIQNIDQYELNTFNVSTTAGPTPGTDGGWGPFPNKGAYPNGFNSSEQMVAYPPGSQIYIQIREKGTQTLIYDNDNPLPPFPNANTTRATIYTRP